MARKGISLPKIGAEPPDPVDIPVKCHCGANSWEVYIRVSPKTSQWLWVICKACGKYKNL